MKKAVTTYVLLLATFLVQAQVPDAIKYQAVVRDNTGTLIQEQDVGFRISILNGSATGTVEYQETQSVQTNVLGLASLDIGNGDATIGDFYFISWSAGPKFLKIELDPTGGTSYSTIGTSEILSVPYALYARNAFWSKLGNNVYYNSGYIGVGTNIPATELHVVGTVKATSYQGDGSLLTGTGDNLGNHTATQNIKLGGKYLSGDGGNEGIFVTSDGKVGIGTNSVGDALLDVQGNIHMSCAEDGGTFLRFRENNLNRWSFLYKSWDNDRMTIYDEISYKNVMVLEPTTGYVGFGSAGQNILDVKGSGSQNGGVTGFNEVVGHFKNTGSGHSAISVDANSNQDAVLYLSENGTPRWSIRTDVSDDFSVSVKNWLEFRDHSDNDNQVAWELYKFFSRYYAIMHGDIYPSVSDLYYLGGAGSPKGFWNTVYSNYFTNMSSKSALKDSDFSYGLKEILDLAPVSYSETKDDKVYHSLGLDPKETETIIPEVVHQPENPLGDWGMKYNQLIPVLIKAIQEQQEQIESLKTQVAALQK